MQRIGAFLCVALCFTAIVQAEEVEVTLLWDSFDGCGCMDPYDDPISCAPCPDPITVGHPDSDVCGPNSIDQDWYNFGWPADFLASTTNTTQGFASQCFRVGVSASTCGGLPNGTFNDNTAAMLAYDHAAAADPNPPEGYVSEEFGLVDFEAMRVAQGLPAPIPDGPSYIAMDVRRSDTMPQDGMTTSYTVLVNGLNAHPDATNDTVDYFTNPLPNDGAWYSDPVIQLDHYITGINIAVVFVGMGPSGFTPPPNSDVLVCVDNLRYVYTADVAAEEIDCTNGIDDDLNGLIDCEDPLCANKPICTGCQDPVFDADADGDVDQDDFAVFQTCMTGAGDPGGIFDSLPAPCDCFDVTGVGGVGDGSIDQQDYFVFEGCATGPSVAVPGYETCDD